MSESAYRRRSREFGASLPPLSVPGTAPTIWPEARSDTRIMRCRLFTAALAILLATATAVSAAAPAHGVEIERNPADARDHRALLFGKTEAIVVSDPNADKAAAARDVEIERSPADTRDYRALLLDNGLEALLVSDPGTDKAAAALDVNAGGANDPDARPGLAHFLEHMLFLGTGKYPDPGEYHRFIAEHGGSANAATSFAHTNYFFDVDAVHLEGALDRFSRFFVSPRFDPEYVDRERQVVHSEYVSRRRNDPLRSLAAWKQALDPRHPFSRFLGGNATTLANRPGADVRDELIDFYESHYSAHLMKLAVVGREPLDTLERWVRERFAAVPRRDAERLRVTAPLYPEGRLPARLDVEPVRELRSLRLSFEIPPLRPHHRARPLALVSHLLGHEGHGSLLSALKAHGWAEGLSAGPSFEHPDFAVFGIGIRLTEAGLAHVDDVIASVFAYLALIRKKGIKPRYHDELARMARIGFRFLDKASARSHAVSLASALHVYPVHEVLAAPYRFGDFDPALERRFLAALIPERVFVTVVAKGASTDAVAPFYDTPYRLRPIPPETVARWRDPASDHALALPAPNPFVPEDLALIDAPATQQRPTRIVQRPGFDLWHHADIEFGQPRTNFYFAVFSPIAHDSPRHAVLSTLLARVTNDALNEFAYPAALAGQSYALYRHGRGVTARLSGWSDKQALLLERIVSTLRAPPLSLPRFEAEKAEYARQLRNAGERAPHRRAIQDLRELLIDPAWSTGILLTALDTVGIEDLREYVPKFFERGEIVALAHGNVTAGAAQALGNVLERGLLASMRPARAPPARVVRLDPGARYIRRLASTHEDHALAVHLQGRGRGFPERAQIALIAQAIGNRFFHELRTERELGYTVFASPMPLLGVPGLALVVQSPSTPPEALHRQVDAFLGRFGAALREMPHTVFERHRAALESALIEADTRLGERTARYWSDIAREHYTFDRRERLAEAVRAVTRDALAETWRELATAPESARGVVVAVSARESVTSGRTSSDSGQAHAAADRAFGGAETVADPDDFKRRQRYFDDG